MTTESIDRFLRAAILKLPNIIKSRLEKKPLREIYSDYILLSFRLPDETDFDEFCSQLSESHGTVQLYQHARSRDTDFGHSVCAFQQPGTGVMFQICGSTNARGKIAEVDVKVFESAEVMYAHLRDELRRLSRLPGVFRYRIEEFELQYLFL